MPNAPEMRTYLLAILAALVLSIVVTPLCRALAFRTGAISKPGGRHVHVRLVPRLGGVGLYLAWILPLWGVTAYDPTLASVLWTKGGQTLGVVGGSLFLCMVGALDDARGLRVSVKLLAQVVAAIFAFACGLRIEAVALPIFGSLPMGVFALPITILWIVGITNAVNLIDGLDGLAAGVAFFAAFTAFVVAVVSGSTFVALLMASLMGSVIGFLFFNFNPARIFMGDSGSYFLGFVLAASSLGGALQQKASTAVSLLVPVIALGLPIFDTGFSVLRRILEKRPIFSPDRGHVHHRLLDLGLTHRRAVLLLYALSIVLASGAIAVSLGRSWEVGAALFSVTVVFFGFVRFLGGFEYLQRRRERVRYFSPLAETLRRALPQLIVDLNSARDEATAIAMLGRLVEDGLVDCIELNANGAQIRKWQKQLAPESLRDSAQTQFNLRWQGTTSADLRFVWAGEIDESMPQIDLMLQVLVDVFEQTNGSFATRYGEKTPEECADPVSLANFRSPL